MTKRKVVRKRRDPGSASPTTGYRVNALLDAQCEAALGVLQMLWRGENGTPAGIAATLKRCLLERAAAEAPAALESAFAEVMARREALAGKRSA